MITEENNEKALGDSSALQYCYSRHRHSKSASEKNVDLLKVESFHRTNELGESSEVVPSISSCRESPLHKNITDVSDHRASLEKDIEKLQMRLQQEKSMRGALEKAMGRASSTLSPGHRHFASQTIELITEIELLEEEVVKREQHVLSLYRNIFEHVSRPASEHSSVVTSPAHAKSDSKKHPSIISNSFCSSKNFPLRKLHSLATVNDLGKRGLTYSRTKHTSLLNAKDNMVLEKSLSVPVKVQAITKTSAPRSLKDHLYQCPSKLAEEMVRCMVAVYCWLHSTSESSEKSHFYQSLVYSTDSLLPRSNGERKSWSTKSTLEIPWIPKDKKTFSHESYAISNYRVLVEQLEKVNVRKMDSNAQIAFWINLYNSLIMHAYLAYGIPHNSLRRLLTTSVAL